MSRKKAPIDTKMASGRKKFLIFDSSSSIIFLVLIFYRSVYVIAFFILLNVFMTMIANRGFTPSMIMRKLSVFLSGKKKPRFYPALKKDHLFD